VASGRASSTVQRHADTHERRCCADRENAPARAHRSWCPPARTARPRPRSSFTMRRASCAHGDRSSVDRFQRPVVRRRGVRCGDRRAGAYRSRPSTQNRRARCSRATTRCRTCFRTGRFLPRFTAVSIVSCLVVSVISVRDHAGMIRRSPDVQPDAMHVEGAAGSSRCRRGGGTATSTMCASLSPRSALIGRAKHSCGGAVSTPFLRDICCS
jgi:hypothetical protein